MLFSWYFKGFELLRRYLVKHPSSVDLENLNMEVVDLEMAADKASQSVAPTEVALGDTSLPSLVGDDAAAASSYVYLYMYFLLLNVFWDFLFYF